MTKREDMLATATKIVVGDRENTYGGPEDSFRSTASHWSTYLSGRYGMAVELEPEDVAIMMMLLKVSRIETGGYVQPDTWIDAAGYAACGYEIAMRNEP